MVIWSYTSQELPQSNGIGEKFMGVPLKEVDAAVASGQDPRVEVRRRLFNHRNTPHPSTEKTPAELMIRRQIKTRLPALIRPTRNKVDMEAKATDKLARKKMMIRFDSSKHVKVQEMVTGDRVLINQRRPVSNHLLIPSHIPSRR